MSAAIPADVERSIDAYTERLVAERAARGLPRAISEPAVLDAVATVVRAARRAKK